MTPTKLLLGHILIALVLIIAIGRAAILWEAHTLGYPPGGGIPLELIRALPLDWPCVHSQDVAYVIRAC